MSNLIIPDFDLVLETLAADNHIPKDQLEDAAKAIVEVCSRPHEKGSDPICDSLTIDQMNAIQETNIEMAKERTAPSERHARAAAMIEEFIQGNLLSEVKEAEALEEQLVAAALKGELDLDNREDVLRAVDRSGVRLPFIRIWFRLEPTVYSSIRTASAAGNDGGPFWRRRYRCLRAVATTQAESVLLRLFWQFNDNVGSIPIAQAGLISTFVLATHFRGAICILPERADRLEVGASRPGAAPQSRTASNRQTISHLANFPVTDGILNNVVYFASSQDTGISLSVSGTV